MRITAKEPAGFARVAGSTLAAEGQGHGDQHSGYQKPQHQGVSRDAPARGHPNVFAGRHLLA